MKEFIPIILLLLLLPLSESSNDVVYVAKISGMIGGGTENQFDKAIDMAKNGEALIVMLDTTGGLASSMEKIIEKIENSEVPVIIYVAPRGAKAFSAGTFILLSAHLSAMAEATTIGACQPRLINPVTGMPEKADEKEINAYSAMIKSIAISHGRNESMAEKFVTQNLAIDEIKAKKYGVVEIIAEDLNELMEKADGITVKVKGKNYTLHLKDVRLYEIKWGVRDKIINYLTDPSLASLLLTIGMLGLIFGFLTPGYYLPETVGAILIILALYGLSYIGVNTAGILLIILALLFFIIEAKTPTFGFWTTVAIITFIFGIMLIPAEEAIREMPESWYITFRVASIVVAVVITGFFAYAIAKAVKAKREKPKIGEKEMVGKKGIALTDISPKGQVKIMGEIWQAEADQEIKRGEEIVVVEQNRMILKVRKI